MNLENFIEEYVEIMVEIEKECWVCIIAIDHNKNTPCIYDFVTTDEIEGLVKKFDGKYYMSTDFDSEDEDEDDGTFHSCGFLQYEYKIYKIPISKYKKLEKTYIHMRICTGRYTDKAFLLFIKKERGTLALDITNALINAW
ncbi:hypothetical protein LCGC14_1366880 [marine sediment metagenome]|uniref:Uncharacterized protein n=1 Tax=marine sediment metagenome TaxID=412755 RepID=A0A0F9N8H1_9ZZZZ